MARSRHARDSVSKHPGSEIVDLIPALRAFARTFCRNVDDADDLAQETLAKGLSNLHQFSPGTNMKSWLFTIMRNTFYTRIKQSNREAPGAADCVAGRPTVGATQEWSARGLEVHNAIQRLPEQQREVMMLIGVLGMSYEETAEICNCAIGTVKSRLNRARLRLLVELGEQSGTSAVERAEASPGRDSGITYS